VKVQATDMGDEFGKQASLNPHDTAFDKPFSLQMGEEDWHWRGAGFNLVVCDGSR
jgi:hypothetical protein